MNNTVIVTINDQEITGIAKGLPIIERRDEQLDSATIIIAPSTRSERYPMFSEVVISVNNRLAYFYVSEADVDIVSKDPLIYRHTLQLIEPTAVLERLPCDNLTFTQPSAQGAYPPTLNGDASIYDVLMRIRECCQLRRLDSTRPYPFELTNPTLLNYLKGIKAPQFFLNVGNVKNAVNQVFKYLNAISRLSNFTELTADFFNKYNVLMSNEQMLDMGETQSIENYATSLLSNVSNAIADYDDPASTVVYPSDRNWASVRSESGGVLTTDNMMAIVENPIYKIEKFWLWVPLIGERTAQDSEIKFNAAQFIVEKSVYDTLPLLSEWRQRQWTEPDGAHYAWDLLKLGKDAALFYYYLGDSVGGFNYSIKKPVFGERYTIDTLLSYFFALQNNGLFWDQTTDTLGYPNGISLRSAEFANIMWRCQYITTTDTRIEVQKIDLSDFRKNATLQINQATNLVNLSAYGDNMSGLLQRMGNPEKIYTKLFPKFEDCVNVGDYTADGYIVTSTQKCVYNDFVSCTIGLTKNFNRRSQFIDISSEVRQFVIPAAGETLVRHCNYGEYLYLDTSNKYDPDESALLTDTGVELIGSVLNNPAVQKVSPKMAELICRGTLDETQAYALVYRQLDTKGIANTIAFTFQFDDNRSAGASTAQKYQTVDNKVVQQPIRYTDELGALTYVYIRLFDYLEKSNAGEATFDESARTARAFPERSDNLDDPRSIHQVYLRSYRTAGQSTQPFAFYKDAAEVPKITIKQHILPTPENAKKIIIGRGFALENPMIRDETEAREITVYTIDDRFDLLENLQVRGTYFATVGIGGLNAILPTIPRGKSWCVGNAKTKMMYLAYNPSDNEPPLDGITLIKKVNRIT